MKVYIVSYTLISDGSYDEHELQAFSTYEKALKFYNELVAKDKEESEKLGWTIEDDNHTPNDVTQNRWYSSYLETEMWNNCEIILRETELM